ncbi:hypothetical protein [Carnobacterium viridans]|uniref:Uncharacterized protein n=1 Tax=Carnobacterium viridans TaxID=174587 RepID=A0A1H0XIW4_9LACT|nr:hypothetical protein [Carnobacterium viridans]SDQ02765.1 hypothetical protein SAMN04487752_0290 [Carnobacterium viridans]
MSAKNKEFLEDLDDIRSIISRKKTMVLLLKNNGKLIWLDKYKDDPELKKKANEQTKELNKEVIGIDLVEHESKIKSFFDALEKDEFTGKEALRDEDFETLMELLEEAFEAKEDMKEEEKIIC